MSANQMIFVIAVAFLFAVGSSSNVSNVDIQGHKSTIFLGEKGGSRIQQVKPPEADATTDAPGADVPTGNQAPEASSQDGNTSSDLKASDALTSASMEAAITDLMLGKTAFGATPMGGSIKQIQKLITKEMMPKVIQAKKDDQNTLDRLIADLKKCGSTMNRVNPVVRARFSQYLRNSNLHRSCRGNEAVKLSSSRSCRREESSLRSIKTLKCKNFADVSRKYGDTNRNRAVVSKAGSESIESYIRRIDRTVCPTGRKGSDGMLGKYLQAKKECNQARSKWVTKSRDCKRRRHAWVVAKSKCNQYQTFMDSNSCKSAVLKKDSCESYSGCYYSKLNSYRIAERKVRIEEKDRRAEWRGLKRIGCLIDAFADGKVSNKEVDACKRKSHSTKFLDIRYPKIPRLIRCTFSPLYPATGAYQRREIAPLPSLARGTKSAECSGIKAIATKPARRSPKSCKCRRVVLNGHYSAGPMVKCTNCLDVRRSRDRSSCPAGTKIFSPASRADWKTFLSSAGPLRAPNWIIDVTRPQNGCGGCKYNVMNSGNKNQKSWRTSDGSPWWLRSTTYGEPNGDYNANCFLDLWKTPRNENDVTFNDGRCNYHSKSYYCQRVAIQLKPKAGSPASCKCSRVALTGRYSAGALVRCDQCLTVYRSSQKNSCPNGMKIFSPRSRSDWKTFLTSAGPLRAPHWIIDVTRPQNSCGGCTRHPMKSTSPQQASWRTSDGSQWWLRNSKYKEPNGDYSANCFMDLWKRPRNENDVTFNDGRCFYRSRSYYCQPVQQKRQRRKVLTPRPTLATRYIGKTVALHSKIHNRFVRMNRGANMDTSSPKNANDLPKGWTWERFTVVDAGNGQVALHNKVHNRFARMNRHANMDRSSPRNANALPRGWSWERFTLVNAGNGEIALHNRAHNRFIRMRNNADMDASSRRNVNQLPRGWTWERFKVVIPKNDNGPVGELTMPFGGKGFGGGGGLQ
jgi:hypothetical protein